MATSSEPTTQPSDASSAAVTNLVQAFQANVARCGEAAALRTPGDEVTISWREYGERVRALAAGLAAHGIGPGDTVAMMLANRPETHLVDVAALHLRATPFSVYNTSSPEQIEYVVRPRTLT